MSEDTNAPSTDIPHHEPVIEPRRAKRLYIVIGIAVLVLLGGYAVFALLTAGKESTDDAQVAADVVPVAHTGLDHLLTVGDVWRELPMDRDIVMRWWRVPREEIPPDREGRIDWLFGWWERIDDWIEENRWAGGPRR